MDPLTHPPAGNHDGGADRPQPPGRQVSGGGGPVQGPAGQRRLHLGPGARQEQVQGDGAAAPHRAPHAAQREAAARQGAADPAGMRFLRAVHLAKK